MDRKTGPVTADELNPSQRSQLEKDASELKAARDWTARHGTVVVEEDPSLGERVNKLQDRVVDEVGERAKAIAKKGLAPKDSPGRRQKEEIRRQVEGQSDAQRLAAHDTAKDFQEAGGDVAEAGSRVAATTAIEAAKVELGTRAVGLGAGAIREVVGKSIAAGDRTYVVYSIRNAEGQVVYVGRASGAGTPAEVLAARASSHEYRGVGTFRIEEAQATRAANRGAEDVIYQRERLKARDEGRTLLNKDNPISPRNPRKKGYVDAYNEEAKQ